MVNWRAGFVKSEGAFCVLSCHFHQECVPSVCHLCAPIMLQSVAVDFEGLWCAIGDE